MRTIPYLRFKGFNENWKLHKIGDFIRERSTRADAENPLYSLTIENGIVPKSERYERSFLVKDIDDAYKVMYPNDFAYNPMNLRFGAIAKHIGSMNVAVSKYYNIFYCLDSCDSDYLKYFLSSYRMIQYYDRMSTGSLVEKKRVHYLDFIHFKKYFPTLPEQQKIASFLSAIDEKIQQLRRKKELLEQYKKGLIQQLFSGKLRFKDENEKAYPDWEEKRLGEIGDVVSGLTYSPDDVNENGVLVLRSSNVQGRRIVFDDNVYVNVNQGDFNPVQEDDILICVRNGSRDLIGKNSIINKESEGFAFGAFMTVFRSKYNRYLFHFFDTDSYKKAVHRNLGATINSINGSDLKKFKVPFPSPEEQQKIASFLTVLDAKIENMALQIAQSQTFKKSLLQQMFV